MSQPNRCPIPTCHKSISADKWMCGKHRRMIPPLIAQAIQHAKTEALRTEIDDIEMQLRKATLRQAMAMGFAEVCEQLGMDIEALFKSPSPGPKLAPVRRAILSILNRA